MNKSAKDPVKIQTMFSTIAHRYDLLNKVLSLGIDRRWRKFAVNQLVKSDNAHYLDVATGTGDLAIAISKGTSAEKIIGLDLSQGMLDVGIQKIAKRNLNDRIEMVKGDSEKLPFSDNYFDAITVAFGVRNFENLELGLSEMLRVLRPGGKIGILRIGGIAN